MLSIVCDAKKEANINENSIKKNYEWAIHREWDEEKREREIKTGKKTKRRYCMKIKEKSSRELKTGFLIIIFFLSFNILVGISSK